MASALYNPFKTRALGTTANLVAGDIRVMLVRSTYTFSAAHEFVADLGAVDNGRSASLTGKTVTSGVFDADNTSHPATAAVACNKEVVFEHTGNDATAKLVCCIDVAEFTPSAAQTVNVAWDNGANRIFNITG